jgi:hypothetical protein
MLSYHARRVACNIAAIRCNFPAQKQADLALYLTETFLSGRFPTS